MADDWIKVRHCLWHHPKVLTLASRLSHAPVTDPSRSCHAGVTPESRSCHAGVTPAYAIGALVCAWYVADAHADRDGIVQMSGAALDQITGVPGLAVAMASVGWLVILADEKLQFPSYQEHNGPTAKARALASRRQRTSRSGHARVTVASRSGHGARVTREEKRREEDNTPPTPPPGGPQKDAAHAREQPPNGAPARRRRGRETAEEARARHFGAGGAAGAAGQAGGPTP